MDDSRTVRWRVDASTSRTVRVLWALGAGTFLAAIALVVFARLYTLIDGLDGGPVLVAAVAAAAVTILAIAVAGDTAGRLETLTRRLPVSAPEAGEDLDRLADVAAGTVAMGALIVVLARGIGGGIGHGLAAITVPLALVAVSLAVFARSTGAIDPEERALYLYDPDEAVDLEHVEGVRVRTIGEWAICTLSYAQPGGEYVPGPRRLAVPRSVARELERLIGPNRS